MRKFLTLICLLSTLGGGLVKAESFFNLDGLSGKTASLEADGITLNITSNTGSFGQTNNRGLRLYSDGSTFQFTTPANYVITSVKFTSNMNGNYVADMGGFSITGNSDWNPFTVGKADDYTWTNESNTAAPITFTTKSPTTGTPNVYISGITVTTKYIAPEQTTNTFTGQYTVTASHDYQTIAAGHSDYSTWTTEPSQGTYTFTGAGTISGGTEITEVPGITMTVGAEGDNNWQITDNSDGHLGNNYNYVKTVLAYNPNSADRINYTSGSFFKFEPIVNGYLTIRGRSLGNITLREGTNAYDGNTSTTDGRADHVFTKPLLAGHTYYLCGNNQSGNIALHSYSFRPAFLAPTDYTAEQTGDFAAGIGTTAYPKVLTEANNNVSHWANRNVASITSTGDVTITGNGWTIVGANAYQPGNSDRHLTALYTMQTSVLEVQSTSPADGSVPALNDVRVIDFVFDRAITLTDSYKITLIVDGQTMEYTQNHVALEGTNTVRLSVDNAYIAAGNTFVVTLAAGSVCSASDATLLNAEKRITFTLSSDEPVVTMAYPTNINAANVGTAIALHLDYNSEGNVKDIKDQKVVATLSADGEEPMTLYAYKDLNNYVFKPTRTLTSNTQYTIFVGANQMTMSSGAVVTHDKAFTFTTGNAAGSSPVLASSYPADGQIMPSSAYSGGYYTLTFDQKVNIEPYTKITVTPRNGSETTASSQKFLNETTPTLEQVDDYTLRFKYTSDGGIRSEGMMWDLVHEILIPANSITTAGGMPNNEPIVVTFRMCKNPDARTLTQTDLPYMDGKHPYTWDFNNFGCLTGTYDNLDDVINTGGTSSTAAKACYSIFSRNYNNKFPGYIAINGHQDNPNKFVQGSELFYMSQNSGTTKYYMDEFKGLRFSIKNLRMNDRIRIKWTKEYGESELYIIGNTHYFTIPSLPSNARVYILGRSHRPLKDNPDPDASGGRFTINSKNAKFVQNWDENNGQEYAEINERIQKTYIVDMDAAGCAKWGNDLTFCISDFSIDKIAISVDDKELTQFDGIAYATDCQEYPVEYKLTNAFGMGDITGMYILDHDPQNSGVNSSSASIFSTDITYAAGVDRSESGETVHQGTIVKATTANTSRLEKYNGKYLFPYFTTDVNTQADELYTELNMTGNMLVGVLEDPYTVLTRETEDNEICYVFTATRYTTDADGNLLYMQPKDDKNWNKQAPVQEGDKWYITENDDTKVEVTYDETKKVYYLLDESGNKIPKVKVGNLPSFQPVMRKGQTAAGKPIDTGNLEENIWQLGPHKSYLKLTKATNVNEVIFFNGEGDEELLDGINTVNNGVVMESGAWYTLQGVKLNGTPKQQGIYIFNNKKVLIK